ncbi:winged helix-turn-helix transcriptional regulator [Bacillus sp. NPDC093026]|uniref:winged helix-turn-helix transcriptional regulator n=1 Tax=Bacillus sp. NPDC093026 TaxID=3363948 RepID=UPI003820FEEC
MLQVDRCPITDAMEILGKKWVILIINQLLTGPKRFCQLENEMKISGRLLSERLKDLEAEGLVEKKVYPVIPVRIEYELTEQGKKVEPVIREMYSWSVERQKSRKGEHLPS